MKHFAAALLALGCLTAWNASCASPDAFTFVETTKYTNGLSSDVTSVVPNLPSGWTLDNRGGAPRVSIEDSLSVLWDISTTEGTALIRPFENITEGTVTAEISCKANGDGGRLVFRDIDGGDAFVLSTVNGGWGILDGSGVTMLKENVPLDGTTAFAFRLIFDMDADTVRVVMNDEDLGTHAIKSDSLAEFRFATGKEETLRLTPGDVLMTANYAVHDYFDTFAPLPVYGWTTSGSVTRSAGGEMALSGASSAEVSFDAVSGKFVASTYFLLPSNNDMTLELTSDGGTLLSVKSSAGRLTAGGKALYTLRSNMWYRLRIEGDTADGSAVIKLNGREVGSVSMEKGRLPDAWRFSLASGTASFDYVEVYATPDHDDYVPAPERAASLDDFVVMINVCSLWRNNTQMYGWAPITPFDDLKPILGYYDEGSPELADWEIKYMVDHGIDVQAFCWYNDVSNGPVKHPKYSEALNDGFQYAKYSDYMKYILILELSSSAKFQKAQWENQVVPYLFENYFLDDRYLKLDNKIVVHTYSNSQLKQWYYFGSEAAAEAEMAFLDNKAKEYGYDGVILLSVETPSYIDGKAVYSWGVNGCLGSYNISQNRSAAETAAANGYYFIPTVSVGYNRVAWFNRRSRMISVEDYRTANEWVRDTYIPIYANRDDWTKNIVLLSTWNEYGEGTYISPAGLNGFGYLDVVREVYTDGAGSHTDVYPTAAQLKRINHLYPQSLRTLARTRSDEDITKTGGMTVDLDTVCEVAVTKTNTPYQINVDAASIDWSDGFSAVSTTYCPIIRTTLSPSVDITDIPYIRLTMQVPEGSLAQVFFTTEADPNESESKSFYVECGSGEMTDYIIRASKNALWTGRLRTLRIDPARNCTGSRFTIRGFALCTEHRTADDERLIINSIPAVSTLPCERVNGRALFPYDPQTSLEELMRVYTTWDKANGVLTVMGNGHTAVFTVGEDTFMADGVSTPLGYTMYLRDGLPMMDFAKLCAALGYTYVKTGQNAFITTPEAELFEVFGSRTEGVWEFNDYDTEGWASTNSVVSIEKDGDDSFVRLTTATSSDPSLIFDGIRLRAEDYAGITFRVRYRYTAGSLADIRVYFTSDSVTSYSDSHAVRIKYMNKASDGWVTYTVMFDEPTVNNVRWINMGSWKGNITSLRFDPFDALGTMDIDYIRLIPAAKGKGAPGLNVLTGTTEPFDFDTFDDLTDFVLESGTGIAAEPFGTVNNALRQQIAGTGYPGFTMIMPDGGLDAARPIYVKAKLAKTYEPENGEAAAVNDVFWVLKNGSTFIADTKYIHKITGQWNAYGAFPAFDNAYSANDSHVISDGTEPLKRLRLQGATNVTTNGVTAFWYDDLSVIPSYAVTYHVNDGTDAIYDRYYALFDEDGGLLRELTVDLTPCPERGGYLFRGWSRDPDAVVALSGKSLTVPLQNVDIDLYAVWERDTEIPEPTVLVYDFETPDSRVLSGTAVSYQYGMMYLNMVKGRSITLTPTSPLDTRTHRYMILNIGNNTKASSLSFTFKTTDHPTSSTAQRFTIPLTQNSKPFLDYVIDLRENANWTGDFTGATFSVTGASSGTLRIESVTFATEYTAPAGSKVYEYDLSDEAMLKRWCDTSTPDALSVAYEGGKLAVTKRAGTGTTYLPMLPDYAYTVADYPYLVFKAKTSELGGITTMRVYSADAKDDLSEERATMTTLLTEGEYSYMYVDWRAFFGEGHTSEYHKRFMYSPSGTGTVRFDQIYLANAVLLAEDVTSVEKFGLYPNADRIRTDGGYVTVTPYVRMTDGEEHKNIVYAASSLDAAVKKQSDGTLRVTAKRNGEVTVYGYVKGMEKNMAETTITLENQTEHAADVRLKWVSFGNSIHKHPANASLGWNVDYGMAASAEKYDYIHRLWYYLERKYGVGSVTHVYGEGAGHFETDLVSFEEGYDFTEYLAGMKAFIAREKPDIVTIQYGENGGECTPEKYMKAMRQFVGIIHEEAPDAIVLLTEAWRGWGGVGKMTGARMLAEELDLPIADLSVFTDDKYSAVGLFEHSGVAAHPGDLGMEEIAKVMYEKLNVYLTRDVDPKIGYAETSRYLTAMSAKKENDVFTADITVDFSGRTSETLAVAACLDESGRLLATKSCVFSAGVSDTWHIDADAETALCRVYLLENDDTLAPIAQPAAVRAQ